MGLEHHCTTLTLLCVFAGRPETCLCRWTGAPGRLAATLATCTSHKGWLRQQLPASLPACLSQCGLLFAPMVNAQWIVTAAMTSGSIAQVVSSGGRASNEQHGEKLPEDALSHDSAISKCTYSNLGRLCKLGSASVFICSPAANVTSAIILPRRQGLALTQRAPGRITGTAGMCMRFGLQGV